MNDTQAIREPTSVVIGESLPTLSEFQVANTRMFPTIHSLNWFVRRNRAALTDADVLLEISGRIFIDPSKFDLAVRQIGAQKARRRV